MLHLARGANAGELVPKPEGIEPALDEAWPNVIGRIRHDVARAIDKANRTIDRLNGNLNTLKNDGDRLFVDFKAERDCWRDAEARLAHIEGKSREVDEPTMRSSSSSAKRKAEEHPPPTRSTALPSTTTLVDGLLPLKKRATEGGPSDLAYDPYNPDNWAPGTYVEDYLDYGRAESSSTGPATQG